MADYLALAAQLRATRQAEQQARSQQTQSGGAATSQGGTVGQGMFQTGGYAPQQNSGQNSQQQNPLQTGLDAYNKYKDASKLMGGSAPAAFTGATPAAMSAMSAGGGSSLGSMGLMSSAPAVSFPGAAAAGGSAAGAGGGGAAASGASGAMSSAGPFAALAAAGYLADKEMNESEGSFINADKLNDAGSIGNSGIGLRFGDFANGFNPATWLSDPKKAGKGLVNAFTFGLGDKFFDLF